MRRGVETATSTPQASSNIHSFLGLLTRATVRGTPNSVLASSESTRLTLSSPVAATTTSQSARPASLSASISQASASSQTASGTFCTRSPSASRSTSSTWCPLRSSSRAMDRPTLPAPAMTTRMGKPFGVSAPAGAASRTRSAVGEVLARAARCGGGRPPGRRCPGLGRRPSPRRVRYARPATGGALDVADPAADPRGGHRHLGDDDLAGGVGELGDVALGQQPAQHLVARPLHGGDGGDAEALVDLGAAGVVDAGDDVLDAVLLARDAGREDVGVVAAGDGGERVGVVDARGPQGVAVEADPRDGAPLERGAQPAERGLVLVDDGHLVAGPLDGARRGRRRHGRSP